MDDLPNHIRCFQCSYCGEGLAEGTWNSSWGENDEQHYRSLDCESCGKINWFKAAHPSSGHCSVSRNKETIDSMIKKVMEV